MRNSMSEQDVRAINRTRPSLLTEHFVFKYGRTATGPARFAFAFSRKCGMAVLRNRYRRRIRELLRHSLCGVSGIDILCVARGSLKKITAEGWHGEIIKICKWGERFKQSGAAAVAVL